MKKTKKYFFNYATVGPMNKEIYDVARVFLDDYYYLGPPEVVCKYEEHAPKLALEASKLLNCEPDEITYLKNTTEGINIAADILPLGVGDEVLILKKEYPASLLVWSKKSKTDGIKLKIIDGRNSKEAVCNLLAAISHKTKAIIISWAQCHDGYLPDLNELSTICRARGVYLIVDGVQGIGNRVLDLQKTPLDILVCGGQKYLGGIVGIGFMYVNKKIMPQLRETKIGIRSVLGFGDGSYQLKQSAGRFQDGTMNLLGIVCLARALRRLNQLGIKNIENKNYEITV